MLKLNVKKQTKRLGISLITVMALTGAGLASVTASTSAHRHARIHHTRIIKHVRHNHKAKVVKHKTKPVKKHKARKRKMVRKRGHKKRKRVIRRHHSHKKIGHQKSLGYGAVAQPASGPRKHNNGSNTKSHQFNRMFKLGKSKLGTPYLLGAVGTHEFDCGSFTQYLYGKVAHKGMSRNAQVQYDEFRHVSEHHAKPGDLVFFGGSTRTIGHVGLYIGHGKMIDSQLRGVVIEHIHAPWWNAVGFARPANLK